MQIINLAIGGFAVLLIIIMRGLLGLILKLLSLVGKAFVSTVSFLLWVDEKLISAIKNIAKFLSIDYDQE